MTRRIYSEQRVLTFLLVGLVFIGVGCWMMLNPDRAAKAAQASQHRGGFGSWNQDEPQMPHRNELGIWTSPGDRARSMRWTGLIAIVVGLGSAIASLAN